MTAVQDQLIARLLAGELGPWGGQAFVGDDGIMILRPDTMQWETIRAMAGDATLTNSTLGNPVEMGSTLEWANEDDIGLQTGMGMTTSVGGSQGGMGHAQAAVVSAQSYSYLDFVRTELGEIRLTEGQSNGATGPLSPIRNGQARDAVDKDGNVWLPVVRFGGVDAERRGPSGPGGMW